MKHEADQVGAIRTRFTPDERKTLVLTCPTCGGKFALRKHTRRLATNNFCTFACRQEYQRKKMGLK